MKQFASILVLGVSLAAAHLATAAGQGESVSPLTQEGSYWVRTIQGSVATSAVGQLRVETTGNASVRGMDVAEATYTIKVRVKAFDAREAETLLQRFNVKTGTEGGWAYLKVTPPRSVSLAVDLTVIGPRALRNVWVETRGGNVQASNWDGGLEAKSGGGQIAVDRIGGHAELRTAGGNIEVGKVGGPVRCLSGGGAIRVESAGGPAWLETAGGEIFVHQAAGPVQASTGGGNIRIERAAATVYARTAGGLIQVRQADGAVTAETSGGAIQVNSANNVRCESAGGAIRLQNVAGALHASTNAGSILAELVSGHGMANSMLTTSAGDITVVIPSNVALTIQAINESGGSGRVISDFPQVRREPSGAQQAPSIFEGALNGGGPVLRVNVQGGTIYLRRAK